MDSGLPLTYGKVNIATDRFMRRVLAVRVVTQLCMPRGQRHHTRRARACTACVSAPQGAGRRGEVEADVRVWSALSRVSTKYKVKRVREDMGAN